MQPQRYEYIDALRGYAILMVIAVHSSQYFEVLASYPLIAAGARGVQLFFVASGMTLCLSWTARDDGALPFYVRRFFRIAPMFYLAIVFFIFTRGFGPSIYAPDGIGLRHILMTATFTHGLMPDTITSLVPGSWSIADEMMFYAAFPLMMAVRVRWLTAAVIVGVVTVACTMIENRLNPTVWAMSDTPWKATWATFYNLWIVNQLPCFLFGILVARWIVEDRPTPLPAALVVGAVALAVWNVWGLPIRYWPLLSTPVQFGAIFSLFALGLSKWQPIVLVNPVICWIGKVSYSGYLIHLALITTLPIAPTNFGQALAIILTITIALSSMTYLWIERPFTRLGQRFARRLAPDHPRGKTEAVTTAVYGVMK
jgi:peptidoglycan/LPS O-acetylase OafA/YrhL